ncbi:ATP-NAD kinase family protein [Halodesulfurarchaeum sp.]|uniref:ATP-NAD kinase family protein n=1 Tax=Halodesulfurarchaeum sp. TaxID=1980530 RepID=UPI002FC3A839
MRRIGFVVNPIAGMGGRVGLKGTDGNVETARERGAEPRAPERGESVVQAISNRADSFEIVTWDGEMGAAEAERVGVDITVVGEPDGNETSAADTVKAVEAFLEADVDIVLFVGGDGTAVDVFETLAAADEDTPMLGAPAGVKVYSSVFAVSPQAAGQIAATFDRTTEREVNDIDEEAYREGEVRAELKGLATVPVAADLQSSKQIVGGDVEGLAQGIVEEADSETTYILGPGGTLKRIKSAFGIDGSPLGVDVIQDGELLLEDGSEAEILDVLGTGNEIIVSPIGGQGFVFGRGNDQISPPIIRQSLVTVVSSAEKLDETDVLHVDTGDEAVDEELRGWIKVRIGRVEQRMVKIV